MPEQPVVMLCNKRIKLVKHIVLRLKYSIRPHTQQAVVRRMFLAVLVIIKKTTDVKLVSPTQHLLFEIIIRGDFKRSGLSLLHCYAKVLKVIIVAIIKTPVIKQSKLFKVVVNFKLIIVIAAFFASLAG